MKALAGLAFAAVVLPVFGQTARVLKDRHGIPVIEISELMVSRNSPTHVSLSVVAKNISGTDLIDVRLDVSSIAKDGTKSKAGQGDGVNSDGLLIPFDGAPGYGLNIFKKDSVQTPSRIFWCPKDSCTDEFELSLSTTWQSPEDLKARTAKQLRDNVRYAKIHAEEEARANSERVKAKATCTAVYKSTSDKKVADLTVKEEQQVRACQALGMYSAR